MNNAADVSNLLLSERFYGRKVNKLLALWNLLSIISYYNDLHTDLHVAAEWIEFNNTSSKQVCIISYILICMLQLKF